MDTKTAKIEKTKSNSFSTWLETKPYWEQYLWRLHLEKDTLDDADINKCIQYLMEDHGLIKTAKGRIPVVFPSLDLEVKDAKGPKTILNKIENLKEVNAIDDGCVIEFGKNLTIIYGDNGSGKSGIGRLLSNACHSRKPRKLLPNARRLGAPASGTKADFHVTTESGLNIINFNLGETHKTLKAFSVFDHECALIHLNSDNKIEFVPSKILVFDEVFKSILAIEAILQREIALRNFDNPSEGIFTGSSPITNFLKSLSYNTTDKEIDDTLKFTKADKNTLAEKKKEVAKKLKLDISAQKTLLKDEGSDLDIFRKTLSGVAMVISKEKEKEINAVIKEIKGKKDIVDKLSVKSFDFAAFKNVGSAEWKSLILAAQKLYEKETASNSGKEPEHCLLCRQTLTVSEKTLFGDYWKFLSSTAESELKEARETLNSHLRFLENADKVWPALSNTEIAVKILKKDAAADLKKIKESYVTLHDQLQDWIDKIKKEQNVTFTNPRITLTPIVRIINEKASVERKLIDPTLQIRALNNQIDVLVEKQRASLLISKIKKYLNGLRWKSAISSINLPTVRGSTTRKKTEIMGELVISQYVDIFNIETEQLDCNFGLKVDSHGRDSATIKTLKLIFAPGINPSDILSDGEQTVSALADFLTEAKLDKNNSGIIFDDPVTSLDHERRSTIAKRLVMESKERQVVVLTHDIVFLLDLQNYAKRESVAQLTVSIRKVGNKIGIVKPDLPWVALDVKKKVGYLRNELPVLKKAETGDPDEYRNKVRLWYMLLRESWERAVEERLFKGVVQRFNKTVQTQKLAYIEVTEALIKDITDGMSESSNWLHDMAVGVNPAVPNNSKLTAELQILDDFITKCKAD